MSDNSHANPPVSPDKNPSKIRHTEDEKRIIHENTAEESRLEHREDTDGDENLLKHDNDNPADDTTIKHDGSTAPRDNLLPAVRKQDETAIAPDVSDNGSRNDEPVTNTTDNQTGNQTDNQTNTDTQNDEYNGNNSDIEGKLAGILSTIGRIVPDDDNVTSQAIKHDIVETPAAILSAISEVNSMRERGQRLFFENKDKDNEPVSSSNVCVPVKTSDEPDDEPPDEPILALPEPALSLPPGKEAESDTALTETDKSMLDADNGESVPIIEPIEKRDYYEVLGVGKDADEGEIKNAYRALAKKYHPDVNSGDKLAEAKFKEVNEAYSTIIDPQKRQAYDQKTNAKAAVKTTDKAGDSKPSQRNTVGGKADVESKGTADGKNGKTPAGGKNGGKRKDRFMRRVLDKGFIFSQAAAHLMPDEQRDEDSGTRGVRKMISEGAKIIKIFATAEKSTESKMRHSEDEERLTHEDTTEDSRLEHEEIDGESLLQLEDSETPKDKLLTHEEIPQLTAGDDVTP